MMCGYPSDGDLDETIWHPQGIGRRGVPGASLAHCHLSTWPVMDWSFAVLVSTLFIRGAGLSAVGVPSITSAYASVKREDLPMATTAVNILQRLGGPTLTTLCATFLGWRLAAADIQVETRGPFTEAFLLLCAFHVLLLVAAMRLPLTIGSGPRLLDE